MLGLTAEVRRMLKLGRAADTGVDVDAVRDVLVRSECSAVTRIGGNSGDSTTAKTAR